MKAQLIVSVLFVPLAFGQSGVIHPVPIVQPEAVYTEEARIAGIEGKVEIIATIDEKGRPQQARVLEGLGLGLDEKALESVQESLYSPAMQDGKALPFLITIPVNFLLSEKQSRWHLLRANFETPEGVSRPTFRLAPHPTDAGISRGMFEEGRILAAIGRYATVSLTFDIDEQGYPVHFKPMNSSRTMWEEEAVALVRNWRFYSGMKNGVPVTVPCTVTVAWGQRKIAPHTLSEIFSITDPQLVPTISTQGEYPDRPLLISSQAPQYTAEALTAKIEGSVMLSVIVGKDGSPENLKVVRSLGYGLDEQAVAAVSKWRFARTIHRGQPVSIPTSIEVKFYLPKKTVIVSLPGISLSYP